MLSLIYAPNKIFKEISAPVEQVDDTIRDIIDQMFELLEKQRGIGLAANMVGILKRIVVINSPEDKVKMSMVNPQITYKSAETQQFEEASLSYPNIEAIITRPKKIKLSYLDYNNQKQEMEAEGFLATLIQHEIDYLDGKVFLDYLSKLKRDKLLKRMEKLSKFVTPHVHGEHCNH